VNGCTLFLFFLGIIHQVQISPVIFLILHVFESSYIYSDETIIIKNEIISIDSIIRMFIMAQPSHRFSLFLKWPFRILGFIFLYSFFVYLACRYNDYPPGDWQSVIWADKAGYYIYLPATFIHGYHQSSYPEGIEERLGKGFRFEGGKLYTKYPCGVALLVMPFFLVTHLLAIAGHGPADGFSGIYYEMANYTSIFYYLIGGLSLFIFLRRRYPWWISAITIILIMFGTNLYFYAFRNPLSSHVYSFALFSLLLLSTDNLWRDPKTGRLFLVSLIAGLIVLVRHSNVLFLLVVPFLGLSTREEFIRRLRFIISPIRLMGSLAIFIVVLAPQMAYLKFLSGSYFYNAYGEEGFTNWAHPKILIVLTSPLNGLLPYTPAFLLVFIGFIAMIIRKEKDRWLVVLIFLMLLYLVSSWWTPYYGCSFGQRSFIEYLPLFSLPLATLFNYDMNRKHLYKLIVIGLIIVYLVYVNISLVGIYNRCYQGTKWDWCPYKGYYQKAHIFPFQLNRHATTYRYQFESKECRFFTHNHIAESSQAYSGNHLSVVNDSLMYSDGFGSKLEEVITGSVIKVKVGLKCNFTGPPGKSLLVCSISWGSKQVYYDHYRLDLDPKIREGVWGSIETDFVLPGISPPGFLKVYVWSFDPKDIYIDDFYIKIYDQK